MLIEVIYIWLFQNTPDNSGIKLKSCRNLHGPPLGRIAKQGAGWIWREMGGWLGLQPKYRPSPETQADRQKEKQEEEDAGDEEEQEHKEEKQRNKE